MQKFNEPVRIAPCGSLTESGRLSSVCQYLLDPRPFNQNTKGAARALVGPEKAVRGGMKGGVLTYDFLHAENRFPLK